MTTPKQLSLLIAGLPIAATHFTPKELAAHTGYSVQFILDCFDSGKVKGFQANGRSKKEVRKTTRLPRRLVILWLLSISNFDDETGLDAAIEAIDNWPREMLQKLYAHIGRKLTQ